MHYKGDCCLTDLIPYPISGGVSLALWRVPVEYKTSHLFHHFDDVLTSRVLA